MVLKTASLHQPRKLQFLLDMHPYKVAYGGRNSLKSHSFAGTLLTLGVAQDLRILCAREIQKSLAQSVHQLLQDKIEQLDYSDVYDVTDDAIRSRVTNTLFRFTGLADHTADSLKSYEGFDIAWLEEAQAITRRSRQILFPTIFRTPGAEIWESFNPGMDTDDVWERYVINPPPGAKVVEMNYRDAIACGWWTNEQEQLRQYDLVHAKSDYDNIWEGKPRSVVAGAIYTTEITDMQREHRFRLMPYDPRLPVHRIWDLGWNDLMVVIMVQKPTPSSVVVVNYLEDKFIKYSDLIADMKELKYNFGEDWLPHDGDQHDPKSGTSAKKILKGLGCNVKDIPKSNPESRIRAARMMFPRVYCDNTKRDVPPERPDRLLGAGHLMDRLKRYKRHIPKNTQEDSGPLHDINSHGADAWGGLAEVVDRIRNTNEMPVQQLPGYSNSDSSMGTLG
jgi:phage terminase large subunit